MASQKEVLIDPIFNNNPIALQVLGICSALAVTISMSTTLVMCIAVIFVTTMSNLAVSLVRNRVPTNIRIIVQMTIISSLVIIVDQVLQAVAYDISKSLSVFVGLIITNCIIMGRIEAFSLGNTPWKSVLDGLGNGAAYGGILIIVAFFRELLGNGTLLDYPVVDMLGLYDLGYKNNGMMLLPPMALIVVALIIWVQRAKTPSLIEKD